MGVVSTGSPEWEHRVTQSEWQRLLQTDSNKLSILERFLGSLSLLVYWIKEVSSDKYLHSQVSRHIPYI